MGGSCASPGDAGDLEAFRGVFGAMHPGPTSRKRTAQKRKTGDAQANDKGVQVEVYDLDGLTVPGLQALCTRLCLRRNGLRSELITRVDFELKARCAQCAGEPR